MTMTWCHMTRALLRGAQVSMNNLTVVDKSDFYVFAGFQETTSLHVIINPHSSGIDFRRQNLTYLDVRF